MNTLQRCFSGSKRIRHFLLLTLLLTLWLSSCQKELVPLQGSGLTVEEARGLYEQDPSHSALGVRDGVEDPDAPVYEIDWEHARSYRSQGKGVDVVEAVIIQGPGSIPVYNSGASFDTTAHLRYQTQRRLVVIKNDQSRTSMFVLKISPDAASLTGISARISGTDLDHYHPDFEGILQFSSLKDTIYRTFLVKQGADITIGPPGLSSHATGGQGIETRDIDCFPLIIPVGCPCCGHFPGESCRCSTQPYYESVIWCLSTFGGETGSGTGYDDYVPPGDTGTGTTGGGGGTPYHELSSFSKKQLKGYLQALKVRYHFTLSLDELIRLSSGCYTVDPDTDEVTFDEGCAISAIADQYLDLIDYSDDYQIAHSWLTTHPESLSVLLNHRNANSNKIWINAFHEEAIPLAKNGICDALNPDFVNCVADKIAFDEFGEAANLLNQIGYETYEEKMEFIYDMSLQTYDDAPCPTCSVGQREILFYRHNKARERLKCILEQLSNYDGTNPSTVRLALDANFGGNHSKIIANVIKFKLSAIRKRSVEATYAIQLTGEGLCGTLTQAWAYPGFQITDIRLCDPVYWNGNEQEQWATLIHEWMHQYQALADVAYHGSVEYENLNTIQHLVNADSYAQFVRSVCP